MYVTPEIIEIDISEIEINSILGCVCATGKSTHT